MGTGKDANGTVRVLVVSFSLSEMEFLTKRLGNDPRLTVNKAFADLPAALVQSAHSRPDVVLMPSRWGWWDKRQGLSHPSLQAVYLAAALKDLKKIGIHTVVFGRGEDIFLSTTTRWIFETLGATVYEEENQRSLADVVCDVAQAQKGREHK